MLIFTLRKNNLLESFVVLGVVFFLALVFLGYFYLAMNKAKEMVLLAELRNIRIALNVYKGFNGKYPDDIRELIDKEINWTQAIHEMYKRKYLEHQRVDEEGFPIDPWNNRFVYNSAKGEIYSQTKGYRTW
ncbi:MAG: type II secretion system protein [Candidatus Omnitrophota bacterium]